ncbi:MAG: hypothetical protein Q4A31_05260 [Corynebacterium sp.]|uniref:hypothetical protein n=1 Tax=Corynebacterium sp. TaxID=1720 RepID=UPI0026DBA783|nr:hypothetical protein [Corynebacterium sp.]MDO4761306.1 hypothetical protein [Corynebacterium sp.]
MSFFYLSAIIFGAVCGWVFPASTVFSVCVMPLLAGLLLATFVSVPRLDSSIFPAMPRRFLLVLGIANGVIAPSCAWLLTRLLAAESTLEQAVSLGALLVLLTPCVDYVVVFAQKAGGNAARLALVTPLLLVAQLMIVPIIAGRSVDSMRLLSSVGLLIVVPLGAAWFIQRYLPSLVLPVSRAMDPLMVAVLWVIASSTVPLLSLPVSVFALLALVFASFATASGLCTFVLATALKVEWTDRVNCTFSAMTRNSLVMMPLALSFDNPVIPAVFVCQTFVELVVLHGAVGLFSRWSAESTT